MIAGIGPAGLIVNMRTTIPPWPLPLFALMDVKNSPAVVGVPLITPVDESMESPGGNDDPAE